MTKKELIVAQDIARFRAARDIIGSTICYEKSDRKNQILMLLRHEIELLEMQIETT